MKFDNIKNLRVETRKRQVELAEYLNVKQTTYSKYELGKINIPVEILIKLADLYDVSLDYIVGRKVEKK
jgi:transcriptional regulator with XRE-family HTH domain